MYNLHNLVECNLLLQFNVVSVFYNFYVHFKLQNTQHRFFYVTQKTRNPAVILSWCVSLIILFSLLLSPTV